MRPPTPELALQRLESRRLLAITVAGTAAADVIRIAADGPSILIAVNGVESRFDSDLEGILVNAGGGNDTIRLDDASNLPVSIDGGANDDRIEIGAGDVRSARLFSVDVAGGAGNDSLIVDDALAVAGNAGVSIDNPIDTFVSIVAAPGSIIRADAGSAATAVETLAYNGTAQGDTVYVHSTSALSMLTINGGNGDDSMTVGNDLDSRLRGPVTLNGNAGANVLTIDDSADSFADTYFLSGTATLGTVRKNSGGSTASFGGFGNVSIIAGVAGAIPNNQIFRVDAFPNGISTTIFAGSGDDTLNFGDGVKNLDTFQSNLTFNGGDGPIDTIIYNDTVGTDASSYAVNPTSVTVTGTATLNFLNAEQLSLTANAAANDLRINSTSAELSATLNGGAGNDTLRVGNGDFDATVLNGVSILGGSGTDALIFEDQADDVGNDSYTFANGTMTKGSAVAFWSTASADRVESITLLASANNDTIRVNNALSAIALRLEGGDGNDSFLIASTSDGTTATTVTIVSGAGNDSLDVNSDASGSDALVAFTTPGESFQDFRVRAGGRATIASGPTSVLAVRGLLTLGGRLDVADATMIVTGGDFAAIDALTTAGYAGGSWTGGTAAAAIVSSVAAQGTGLNLAIAVARAADVALPIYGGVSTTAGDIVVRYTVGGDANLDRIVDFLDLVSLSQNYGLSGQTWAQGDFTYDSAGAVGFDDLVVLAQNYGLGVAFFMPARTLNSVIPTERSDRGIADVRKRE